MKITIWHGSSERIEKPMYGLGRKNNDYGLGFYCTESEELAKEWACQSPQQDGFANGYEFDMDGLKVLNLSDEKYTILNWLAILADNRDFRVSTAVSRQGKEYLLNSFLPDITSYDVIIGYRADDSYFSFARSFVNNEISIEQLSNAMRLGKLGEQVVLKSKKAFSAVTFKKAVVVRADEFYAKRKNRNDEANAQFRSEQTIDDINGLYMRDIILGRIDNSDPRLR